MFLPTRENVITIPGHGPVKGGGEITLYSILKHKLPQFSIQLAIRRQRIVQSLASGGLRETI
jgi:hypothetical protein